MDDLKPLSVPSPSSPSRRPEKQRTKPKGRAAPPLPDPCALAQPPASALHNEPLHRIFKEVRLAFRQRALAQMRREGIADVLPGAAPLLLHLGEADDLPLSELARRTGLENSTLTPLVDELERHGLVMRIRGLEDRRVIRLRLTELGAERARHLHALWKQLQQTALEGISEDELELLHRLLGRIARNLLDEKSSDTLC